MNQQEEPQSRDNAPMVSRQEFTDHIHDDVETNRVKPKDVVLAISTVPAYVPKDENEARVKYINGSTYREYIYMNGDWYYYALTKV